MDGVTPEGRSHTLCGRPWSFRLCAARSFLISLSRSLLDPCIPERQGSLQQTLPLFADPAAVESLLFIPTKESN